MSHTNPRNPNHQANSPKTKLHAVTHVSQQDNNMFNLTYLLTYKGLLKLIERLPNSIVSYQNFSLYRNKILLAQFITFLFLLVCSATTILWVLNDSLDVVSLIKWHHTAYVNVILANLYVQGQTIEESFVC